MYINIQSASTLHTNIQSILHTQGLFLWVRIPYKHVNTLYISISIFMHTFFWFSPSLSLSLLLFLLLHAPLVFLLFSRSLRYGWLRLVGSLQIWVSFAKEPCKRDYVLQKRSVFFRRLLTIAPPHPFLHFEASNCWWHYSWSACICSYVCTCATTHSWLLHMRAMHSYVCHDHFNPARERVPWSSIVFTLPHAAYRHTQAHVDWYGVATISRLLQIIGLFCRI